MDQSTAFVPGHVSGFFEINDDSDDLMKVGSRNCGVCISKGVKTRVEVHEDLPSKIEIFINGELREADTTREVVKNLLKMKNDEFCVKVNHEVQSPIGVGYGMSGAGALGASLTLSKVLDLDLSSNVAAAVAHKAEVKCKSGLGDVFPQKLGGMVLSVEPGVPPYGELEEIGIDEELQLVIGTLGSVSTSDTLESQTIRENSKTFGRDAFDVFSSDKSLQNFMRVSKNFGENLGIFDDDFMDILEYLSFKSPYGAAIALLGRSIFSPVREHQVEKVENYYREYFEENQIINTDIDFLGARIIE